MTLSKLPDRKRVSFAEAEGKMRFPAILEWGQLDQRVRSALWNALHPFFENHLDADLTGSYYLSPLEDILFREFVERRHSFASDFIYRYHSKERCLDDWASIFKQYDYVELFDFLTFILRDPKMPKWVVEDVQAALDKSWSPYRLVRKPPTVIPAVSRQEAQTIKADVEAVFESRFEGSKVHLQSALDALSVGENRAVVREAIHAVESAVRDFTDDPNAMLSRALKKLSGKDGMHPALLSALDKLYAYSSDEKGIRHALVFGENEKVNIEEGIFFVSVCSAFVAYLSRKSTAAKKMK